MLDRVWRLVQHLALVCSVGVAVSWAGSGNPRPVQRGAPSSVSSRSGGSIRNPDQDPSELTTDEIEEMVNARNSDCNFNGIDDSIDVANDQDDDTNHDGNIDVCDSDTAFARRVQTDESWRQFAGSLDSSYFKVRFRRLETHFGVLMRYTLPNDREVVTLAVRNLDVEEADTVFVRAERQSGAIELEWNLRLRGRTVPPGRYEFTLNVGSRRSSRRLDRFR